MTTPDAIAKKIAQDLLEIRAVFFRPEEPFIWASGIKSPVYGDVEHALAETIRREYPDAEALMGTATAGIAHAAITAHLLGLPMGYVRAGQKDHGRQNQIEGRLEKGWKVVVVEDLISTGGSVIEVVEALRDAGVFQRLEDLGIQDGDMVKVKSTYGEFDIKLSTAGRTEPPAGVTFAPFFAEETLVNLAVQDVYCPLSKEPDYKKTCVSITKL